MKNWVKRLRFVCIKKYKKLSPALEKEKSEVFRVQSILNFQYLFQLMQFLRSHIYARNYFFKLTQTHMLIKLDNFNSMGEKTDLAEILNKNNIVFVLRPLLFMAGRKFLTPFIL